MLIKKADDQSVAMEALERVAAGTGTVARLKERELRSRRAGLKGEAESAYLIDFHFAQSKNWAVIHDLRLEHQGRTAQIDHLLINRWMDFYVLETKHFHAGLKITEDGEFLRWNDFRKAYEGMSSPLEQNERHIAVLEDVVSQVELPVRLGLRIPPNFMSFVLVSPSARVDRPRKFDASRVIKADQLRKRIWKDIDDENPIVGLIRTAAKIVSGETVEFVARQLAALHVPSTPTTTNAAKPTTPTTAHSTAREKVPAQQSIASSTPSRSAELAPACKSCKRADGAIMHGRFGYYFKCGACQTNTAVRFTCQPGHNPRLRKQGLSFFRDCPECGSTALYYRNKN